MRPFNKLALSVEEQIALWESRGLELGPRDRVKRYLNFISYYRLSPYTLPFQIVGEETHLFKSGTRFDDILDHYTFDRELRLLVLDPIERFEVALRAAMTNMMSIKYGPHWYLERSHFKNGKWYYDLIRKIGNKIEAENDRLERSLHKIFKSRASSSVKDKKRAQERKQNFLRHYLSTYNNPHLPPCWMMVELLSYGDLKWLYRNLARDADKKAIAHQFNLPIPLMESWMGVIHLVRNICAHHERLWNREFGVSPKMPKDHIERWVQVPLCVSDPFINVQRRTYIILVILQYFMGHINPGSGWKDRLKGLMEKYPMVSRAHMGMPEEWFNDPFWRF